MNIVEENIEIYNFIEEKRNKVLYAGATYSKPILTIGIITEKEMTEEDKLLLNDLIKRKFKRCVDHEETLSDVQVKYLSRWDIFLPRFGTETSP